MDELREALKKRRGELQADMNAVAGALLQIDWTLDQMDRLDKGIPIEELIPGAEVIPCAS